MIHFVVDFFLLVKFNAEFLIFREVKSCLSPRQMALFKPMDFGRQPSSKFTELNLQSTKSLIALKNKMCALKHCFELNLSKDNQGKTFSIKPMEKFRKINKLVISKFIDYITSTQRIWKNHL